MFIKQKTLVSRGKVRVVANAQGAVYEVSENNKNLKVNIEQIQRKQSPLNTIVNVKTAHFFTENTKYRVGQFLPGNIYFHYTTAPVTDDPEEYLLWVNGKVKRTFERNPIYCFTYYVPDEEYIPIGEIDPPIPLSG